MNFPYVNNTCSLFITSLFPGPAIVCQGSTHPRHMCVSQTRCLLEVRKKYIEKIDISMSVLKLQKL